MISFIILFVNAVFFTVFTAAFTAVFAIFAGDAAYALLFRKPHYAPNEKRRRPSADSGDYHDVKSIHSSIATLYTPYATSHAIQHCDTTTPKAAIPEPSSLLIAATAATQGV